MVGNDSRNGDSIKSPFSQQGWSTRGDASTYENAQRQIFFSLVSWALCHRRRMHLLLYKNTCLLFVLNVHSSGRKTLHKRLTFFIVECYIIPWFLIACVHICMYESMRICVCTCVLACSILSTKDIYTLVYDNRYVFESKHSFKRKKHYFWKQKSVIKFVSCKLMMYSLNTSYFSANFGNF